MTSNAPREERGPGQVHPEGDLRAILDAAIWAVDERAPEQPFATDEDVEMQLRVQGRSISRQVIRQGLTELSADWLNVKLHQSAPHEIQGIERRP